MNPIYELRMEAALRAHLNNGVRKVAFGDIFLEDCALTEEKNLARIGMTALFPIWKRDTRELISSFHAEGFAPWRSAWTAGCWTQFCGAGAGWFVFRSVAARSGLCGENGEFHTFALRWPDFQRASAIRNWRRK